MTRAKIAVFYADEWLARTCILDVKARGAYITIVSMIYSQGGPIRDDANELAYSCRLTKAKWFQIKQHLLENNLLHLTADDRLGCTPPGFYHPRLAREQWSPIREQVFDRDGRACLNCGSPVDLECDHIIPISRGGTNFFDNLMTLCRDCNRSKGASMPDEWAARK